MFENPVNAHTLFVEMTVFPVERKYAVLPYKIKDSWAKSKFRAYINCYLVLEINNFDGQVRLI